MSKAKTLTAEAGKSSLPDPKVRNLHAASVADGDTQSSTVPIRISHSTKAEMERVIAIIGQGAGRKRVKPDAVLRHALGKLRDQDFEELRSKTVSYSEMFDREFLRFRTDEQNVTRDEFLGLVLLGKVKIKGVVALSK